MLPLLLVFGVFGGLVVFAMAFGRSAVMFLMHRLAFGFVDLTVVVGIDCIETGFGFGNEFFERYRAIFIGVPIVIPMMILTFGACQASAKSERHP